MARLPRLQGRLPRLTLLAPEIVEAILDGRQPAGLQLDDLLTGFPLEWEGQRVARFQLEHPPVLTAVAEPSPPIHSQPPSKGTGLAPQ